jgi:hypothetical protein
MRQWRKRNLSEHLYARAGLKFVCLSIPKQVWYYPVVWHQLIYLAVLLSRHHNLKTVTLELSCPVAQKGRFFVSREFLGFRSPWGSPQWLI